MLIKVNRKHYFGVSQDKKLKIKEWQFLNENLDAYAVFDADHEYGIHFWG